MVAHLVPTQLHDVIQAGRGHFGLVEAMTHGYQGNHLVVLTVFKRHSTLSENFPHQHTCMHTQFNSDIFFLQLVELFLFNFPEVSTVRPDVGLAAVSAEVEDFRRRPLHRELSTGGAGVLVVQHVSAKTTLLQLLIFTINMNINKSIECTISPDKCFPPLPTSATSSQCSQDRHKTPSCVSSNWAFMYNNPRHRAPKCVGAAG